MNYLSDFINLFYPRVCTICNCSLHKHEKYICSICFSDLPKTNYHTLNNNPVYYVFMGRVNIEKATSFLHYSKENKTKNILHAIKYKGTKQLAEEMGKIYARELIKENYFNDVDIIIPSPLHPKKKQIRGYNQSDYFAYGLSSVLNIPVDTNCLIKIKNNSTQTRKNRYNRWQNVENVFDLANSASLKNKHILLVDDVVTTGATLEACAQRILDVNNTKVSIVTIAYASG